MFGTKSGLYGTDPGKVTMEKQVTAWNREQQRAQNFDHRRYMMCIVMGVEWGVVWWLGVYWSVGWESCVEWGVQE